MVTRDGDAPPAGPLLPSLPDAAALEERGAPALPFAVVALGASAGGVEALMRFFGLVPQDSGCAYVAAMHLAPDRLSLLVPLIQNTTRLPVEHAVAGARLRPDRVYVAPPGQYVTVSAGRFVLESMAGRPARPHAIDRLMMSVAMDQGPLAIGIVLTGADGDGSLGVKAIKSEGGFTLAQLPSSAAHPDMPEHAIATGLIDLQLPIEEMPQAIVDFMRVQRNADASPPEPDPLRPVLDLLLARRGLDFRLYKSPMLRRRVLRRMGLARLHDFGKYLEMLRESEPEQRALADDFLIGVTEFFREPDAWQQLADEVLPHMLADKPVGDSFRVWVPGCSTGEEAYTMAMVLLERPELAERGIKLQVFATDIDTRSLETGRKGCYGGSIDATVSAERLKRFFLPTRGGYQVRKELREAIVFAPQNLVTDPPFSHVDLVSCRNLLIYAENELQRRMLNLFHFALEPHGVLFLGKSETVGQNTAQFAPISARARIYRKVGSGSGIAMQLAQAPRPPEAQRAAPTRRAQRDYSRVMRDALADHRIAAAVLANRDGEMLYVYGPLEAYVVLPEGAPSNDLFAILREELRPQVRAAMHKAWQQAAAVESMAELRTAEGAEEQVRIVVSVIPPPEEGLALLTFERREGEPRLPRAPGADDGAALQALEDELRTAKRQLRSTIEELESANEELKVSNEEAMSMNEELQSTNEELETSKEELQSVNEELTTVNNRLNEKVLELEEVNDDLGNLLSSTHIATLFLDRDLRIKRFTPAASRLYSVIATDLNRPITDIASRLENEDLVPTVRRVLADLAPIEREVATRDGTHYLRRVLPYRTRDDRIEGIVVTFVDITQLRQAVQETRRLAAVLQGSSDAVVVHDLEGRVLAWNRGAATIYGYPEGEMLGAHVSRILPPAAREGYDELVQGLRRGERVAGVEAHRTRADGTDIEVSSSMSLVGGEKGEAESIALIERDITEQKRAQVQVRESEQRFRTLADSAPVMIFMADDHGAIEFANREFGTFTGKAVDGLAGRRWWDIVDFVSPEDRAMAIRLHESGERLAITARLADAEGASRWVKLIAGSRVVDGGATRGVVGSMADIDAQVAAEQMLRETNLRKDEFLAMLGHELRNPLVPVRNAAAILRRIGADDTRLQWVADTLVSQVGHVTRLVDDLLDISRVARGVLRLERQPVEVAFVIERAVESARMVIDRKHQRLDVLVDKGPLWIDGDAIRLVQVFANLLINASKYSDEGAPIWLSARREGREGVFTVRDDGLGIAPEMRDRIFDLFVQDARSIDRSEGGLGIGLALVKHLVTRHRGSVVAKSAGVGRGSEFVVRLPLLDAPAPAAPAAPAVSSKAGGRVLLVDDDVVGGKSSATVLRLDGFEVEYVSDPREAEAVALRFLPLAVLLDLAMPDIDGYELLQRLRSMPGMAGAIYYALTGFGRDEDLARTHNAGFSRHFVKPVDLDEVSAALRQDLAG